MPRFVRHSRNRDSRARNRWVPPCGFSRGSRRPWRSPLRASTVTSRLRWTCSRSASASRPPLFDRPRGPSAQPTRRVPAQRLRLGGQLADGRSSAGTTYDGVVRVRMQASTVGTRADHRDHPAASPTKLAEGCRAVQSTITSAHRRAQTIHPNVPQRSGRAAGAPIGVVGPPVTIRSQSLRRLPAPAPKSDTTERLPRRTHGFHRQKGTRCSSRATRVRLVPWCSARDPCPVGRR